jgi:sigma-B regulation protein RsbU (phosphoserine phosphatase)
MYNAILEKNSNLKKSNILIIDDGEVSLAVIENVLRSKGFSNLHFASDGDEGLALAKVQDFDLIILDIFMPRMSGLEFCKEVRKTHDYAHLPIIMQTATDDAKTISEAYKVGANDVVSKPIKIEEFLSRVIIHLENFTYRKRVEQELEAARILQSSILPSNEEIEEIGKKYSLEIAQKFSPCSEIGGDFWGFKRISHSELAIYSVDLSGHGVASALNTFRVHGVLQDSKNFFSSPALCLKKINKKLFDLLARGTFATLFYGILNNLENYLQFSSAGCPNPLFVNSKGSAKIIQGSGLPLGVVEDTDYEMYEVEFKTGDVLMIYSDALIETPNDAGNLPSEEYFLKVLEQNYTKSAEDILKAINVAFEEFTGSNKPTDDLTINIYKKI